MNGGNGSTALFEAVSEPGGSNCTYGGKKVSVGPDTNGNGILDPSETAS